LIDAEDYANIRDSVIGILFLGTPHRGSSTTQLPQVLANITNAALAGATRHTGQIRADLLKSLEKDSGVLKTLSTNFRNQASNIKIVSFIEQKTTPPFKQRVSISLGIAHA
jgi:ankyrin repeat domain-containing protein 50